MNTWFLKPLLFTAAFSLAATGAYALEPVTAKPSGKAYHVTIIWLKKHGDIEAQKQYIEASKRLSKLPGVLSYNIGTMTKINRDKPSTGVDDSYDVAISSTFENKQALENYLTSSEHHTLVHQVLKPMVERYKVYDFVALP